MNPFTMNKEVRKREIKNTRETHLVKQNMPSFEIRRLLKRQAHLVAETVVVLPPVEADADAHELVEAPPRSLEEQEQLEARDLPLSSHWKS